MLHTVREHEFFALMQSKERYAEERIADAASVYRALFTHWARQHSAVAVMILGYLVAKTLMVGKSAVRIPLGEFSEDVSIGKTTLKQHLSGLCEADFIHIYRTVAGEEGHEKEARMFEIDFKALVKPLVGDEKQADRRFKTGATPGQIPTTPRQNPTPPSYIHSMYAEDSRSKDKSLHSARASRSGSSEGTNVIPIPKKPRPVVVRSDSIAAVVSAVQARHVEARVARVASATKKAAHAVTKQELQALLDQALKSYMPDAIRVVVTSKEFGLLRKRMKESAPADLGDFINWTIRYWTTIASQHRNAIRRNETRQERGEKAIPAAPDFASLAYRYPYFLKAFANFRAERNSAEADAMKDRQVETLRKQLQQKAGDIEALRGQLERVRKSSVIRRTPAPVAQDEPLTTDALADAELPEWTTRETIGRKRHAR